MPPSLPLGARLAASLAAFGAVARNTALRRVVGAFLGFSLAEWAVWISVLVYAYGNGGPAEVGVVAVIQLAPAAVVAPLAASLGDRYPRERVLLTSYLLQALAMAGMAACLAIGTPAAVVYAFAVGANVAISLTRPVQAAVLPSLARTPAELTAANVTGGSVEAVSILIGPVLAGVILQAAGPGPVFAASAAATALAALLVAGLPRTVAVVDRQAEAPSGAGVAVGGRRSVLAEAVAGFVMLSREANPRAVVVLLGSASVLWGALDVLLVVLAIETLAMGQAGVGFLNAAMGAGGLIGAGVTALLVGRPRLAAPFGAGILLWGAALAMVGLLPFPLLAIVLLAMAGVGRVVMDVAGRTLLQRVSPDALLARVFGVLEGIHQGSLALGAVLAPLLNALAGTAGAFVAAGVGLVGFTVLSWRGLRRTDAAGVVRPRELAALMSVPFFRQLPGPSLERLAAALIPVSARPGEAIITQGDAGDRFYIVGSGEMVVTVHGAPVRTLGAGDSFGEIALLRDVPRTASVLSVGASELLALDRHHFVEAVTGQPASIAVADEVIHAHLDRPPRDVDHHFHGGTDAGA